MGARALLPSEFMNHLRRPLVCRCHLHIGIADVGGNKMIVMMVMMKTTTTTI